MATATISQLTGRTPLTTDEVEIQATGGGASAKATLAAILALGGSVTKASICAALGLTDIVVTDTDITITKLGADLVTRTIILPLE